MEQLQASNQNGMDRPSDNRAVPRSSQYTVQNNNQSDMNTNTAVGINENSDQRNSDILTTTSTTTVSKQPWENTIPRDNNVVNKNSGATISQSSQSQALLQPQKQTKQKTVEQKKGVSKRLQHSVPLILNPAKRL